MGIGKIIAVVAGVAVGGVAAYNYSTTGCPLGTGACSTEEAAVTAVAATSGSDCALCPSKAGQAEVTMVADAAACTTEKAASCETEMAAGCCGGASKAEVIQVAATEAAAEACGATAACKDKGECDASTCELADACCSAGKAVAAAKAETEAKSCCQGKTEAAQVAKND